jgi:hypothetical protein
MFCTVAAYLNRICSSCTTTSCGIVAASILFVYNFFFSGTLFLAHFWHTLDAHFWHSLWQLRKKYTFGIYNIIFSFNNNVHLLYMAVSKCCATHHTYIITPTDLKHMSVSFSLQAAVKALEHYM